MTTNGKIFRRGVPTAPDVEALMALAFGPGDRLDFTTVEAAINTPRTAGRFLSVTATWRKALFRERGMVP